ncbi:MAG: GrpB family protein [Kangiellaceae bacterium]|nr:GrpB family protein [Kangiellaceae bacterium]MCW8999147.1 GrpB family protein [Kangiellaceae bacterium]MCW9017618.1 GrpB family protein [Kangiellaceae bacterium]
MSHRIIEVVGYDPNWPQLFEIEYQLLSKILGSNASVIEHIGSTSVPLLAAKPVIDILVEVECLDKLDEKIVIWRPLDI